MSKFIKSVLFIGVVVLAFASGYFIEIKPEEKEEYEIALINLDQTVNYNGEDRNFAETSINTLMASEKYENVNFTITSETVAENGLSTGMFDAAITFPNDYSKNLTSVTSDIPTITTLSYELGDVDDQGDYLRNEIKSQEVILDLDEQYSYLYVYEYVSDMGNAQNQLDIVENNMTPVYDFTDTIFATNISSNYSYELVDLPDENVEQVEIDDYINNIYTNTDEYVGLTQSEIDEMIAENSEYETLLNENKSQVNSIDMNGNFYDLSSGLSTYSETIPVLTTDDESGQVIVDDGKGVFYGFDDTEIDNDISSLRDDILNSNIADIDTNIDNTNKDIENTNSIIGDYESDIYNVYAGSYSQPEEYKNLNDLATSRNNTLSLVDSYNACVQDADITANCSAIIDEDINAYKEVVEKYNDEMFEIYDAVNNDTIIDTTKIQSYGNIESLDDFFLTEEEINSIKLEAIDIEIKDYKYPFEEISQAIVSDDNYEGTTSNGYIEDMIDTEKEKLLVNYKNEFDSMNEFLDTSFVANQIVPVNDENFIDSEISDPMNPSLVLYGYAICTKEGNNYAVLPNSIGEKANCPSEYTEKGFAYNGIYEKNTSLVTELDEIIVNTDFIMNNEVDQVDDTVFNTNLDVNTNNMNTYIASVGEQNNNVIIDKTEAFTENQEIFTDYISEITGDTTYQNLVNDFISEENERQSQSIDIINTFSETYTNSNTDGIVNKGFVNFLVNPIDGASATDITTNEDSNLMLVVSLFIVMLILLTIIIIMSIRGRHVK